MLLLFLNVMEILRAFINEPVSSLVSLASNPQRTMGVRSGTTGKRDTILTDSKLYFSKCSHLLSLTQATRMVISFTSPKRTVTARIAWLLVLNAYPVAIITPTCPHMSSDSPSMEF